MKSKIFIFISALFLIAAIAAIGMFYYVFGIPEPEGLSLASWPDRFTDNFSVWPENDGGQICVEEIGLRRLDEYGLWLQVLNDEGQEVFCYNKPDFYPKRYSASELIFLRTNAYDGHSTVFAGSYENAGQTWSYAIGFPYSIGKYQLYYNGGNVGRLSPVFGTGILIVFCAAVLLIGCYLFWLSRRLGKITKGIGNVAGRAYIPLPEKGVFRKIYSALNKMDREIRRSDALRQDTDRLRKEWIANITHDLKTPLSSIKGHAELIGNGENDIILRKVDYMEKLIDDLKLVYQLDSCAPPYQPQKTRLVRFLRELAIDIINDYGHDIGFISDVREVEVSIDPVLFRRAVSNLIVNALIHNPPDTEVAVRINADRKIYISDNGVGISEQEQEKIFDRYYRGTNTKEKTEGSGLGLAIAKQIIELHGGNITVQSECGKGTQFAISL